MPDSPDKTAIASSYSEGQSNDLASPERRGETRYPFMAEAEVTELRSQARVTGRCSDLGAGGCYVDTLTSLAVGSEVRICLARDGRAFEATAVVTYAQMSLGMGLKFTAITRDQKAVLDTWLRELSGGRTCKNVDPPVASDAGAAHDTNRLLVLNELITLLMRKGLLAEREGAAFRRKMFS